MSDKTDIAIIGAGVVGLTIAYEFARAGASVIVIDGAPDVGGACSYANAGLIAPKHVGPLATPALVAEGVRQTFTRPPAVRIHPRLALAPWLTRLVASARPSESRPAAALLSRLAARSAELHRAYFDTGVNPGYRKTGALDVYTRRRRHSELTPDQARGLVPALGPITGAGHDPDEAVVESRAYMRSILAAMARVGAVDVRFNTTARGFVTDHGRVVGVRLADGAVRAEQVVLAAGLGSVNLARSVGVRLPLRGGRGYVVDLRVDKEAPTMPVRLAERRIVVTPLDDRIRVCGMIEFGAEGRPLNQARATAMVAAATAALPGMRVESILDTWCGERPCSVDGVPLIGPSTVAPGLAVAAGHGMWGLVLAPVTAQMLVAQLLSNSTADTAPQLSPDRFSHPR